MIGEAVNLRDNLSWTEKKLLFGKTILVTRSTTQASELVNLLDQFGGEAVELPVIAIKEVTHPQQIVALKEMISHLTLFDWVIFTSVNAVDFFFRILLKHQIDIRKLAQAKIIAIGPKTNEALLARHLIPEPIPDIYHSEKIFENYQALIQPAQHVLIPSSNLASPYLAQQLVAKGVHVTKVDVYDNTLCDTDEELAIERLQRREIDIITFTSSSTVKNLIELLKLRGYNDPISVLIDIPIFCIGPRTAETTKKYGLQVTAVAEQATIASLVNAIIATQHSNSR